VLVFLIGGGEGSMDKIPEIGSRVIVTCRVSGFNSTGKMDKFIGHSALVVSTRPILKFEDPGVLQLYYSDKYIIDGADWVFHRTSLEPYDGEIV